jgi:hypothetical protein
VSTRDTQVHITLPLSPRKEENYKLVHSSLEVISNMSNFIEVEGDWNGFYIKPVFPADRAQVVDYMIPNYIRELF